MKDIYLSIVVPCYNEERNIRLGALESVAHYLSKQRYRWEVFIVDDGSTDETIQLLNEFIGEHPGVSLIKKNHQGKAAAVTAGVLQARGSLIVFTDLDQATPLDQLEVLLPYFSRNFDIVIGSRSGRRKGAPLLRRMMARGFMMLRNSLLDLGISDTQCGFKAFTKKAAKDVFSRLQVFRNTEQNRSGSTVTAGFDVELLYIAKRLGYAIAEVPVEWHYQETRHINPVKDSIESLTDLLKIRLNSAKGLYS